jgi:hypothetical protein
MTGTDDRLIWNVPKWQIRMTDSENGYRRQAHMQGTNDRLRLQAQVTGKDERHKWQAQTKGTDDRHRRKAQMTGTNDRHKWQAQTKGTDGQAQKKGTDDRQAQITAFFTGSTWSTGGSVIGPALITRKKILLLFLLTDHNIVIAMLPFKKSSDGTYFINILYNVRHSK